MLWRVLLLVAVLTQIIKTLPRIYLKMSSGTVLLTIHWILIGSGYSGIQESNGRNTNSHALVVSVEREALTPHTKPCLEIFTGF